MCCIRNFKLYHGISRNGDLDLVDLENFSDIFSFSLLVLFLRFCRDGLRGTVCRHWNVFRLRKKVVRVEYARASFFMGIVRRFLLWAASSLREKRCPILSETIVCGIIGWFWWKKGDFWRFHFTRWTRAVNTEGSRFEGLCDCNSIIPYLCVDPMIDTLPG